MLFFILDGHDLLNFDDTSIKQLRNQNVSPDNQIDVNGSQYLVKTKLGSLPNRNRSHLHPSSLIYEDEEPCSSAITGGISEFFAEAITTTAPLQHHTYSRHQQQQSIVISPYHQQPAMHQPLPIEYYLPSCIYHNHSPCPNHYNYFY